MEQDWDLNAVVRGCAAASGTVTANRDSRDHLLSFLRPFEGRNEIGDMEEFRNLYKRAIFTKSETPLIGGMTGVNDLDPHPPLLSLQQKHIHVSVSKTKKPKRRKNPQKKICHMPAEGLTSDVWAWRKYGQKPIKGSPYPRGYYRCSSSKACLARKQVERNRSDPSMFIVTFTAEHNHPAPTHRSSLAGSTRQKPLSGESASNTKATLSDVRAGEEDEENRLTEMVNDDDELFAGLEELVGTSKDEFFADYIPTNFP